MTATCPTCGTTYRLDPRKVPPEGVRARCTTCEAVFRVEPEEPLRAAGAPEAESAPAPAPAAPARPAFGVADPDAKARRLARALISDIVVYHPERRERSMEQGTLRHEFREEIRKSWDEYVGQVGDALARRTPYFRDALNEILVCPRCKGPLEHQANPESLVCRACALRYEVRDGIPIMLIDEAQPL